ncbi:MAG: ACT domain-containing protein [Oscillospiraceae bacterium]
MYGVNKISSEQDVMLISFTDIDSKKLSLSAALLLFARNDIVVDMICQSAPRGGLLDYSFTTEYKYFDKVLKTVASYKNSAPLFSSGYSKINLFGEEMVNTCGVAARALETLEKSNIEIFMITTSDLDISLLLRDEDEDTALKALSKAFVLL